MEIYISVPLFNEDGTCYGYHYYPAEPGSDHEKEGISRQELEEHWQDYQERYPAGNIWDQLVIDWEPLI